VGVRVCTRANTHILNVEYTDVNPRVGTRHLKGPKNPYGLNLGMYVFVHVYKVHTCKYMLGDGMRSCTMTNCFFAGFYFFFRKTNALAKDHDVNVAPRTRIDMDLAYILDPQSSVLNYISKQ